MLTKIIYALLGIAVLSSLYLAFFGQEAEAPTAPERAVELPAESVPPTVDSVEAEDTETTETAGVGEASVMMETEADAAIGHDVGMEMPPHLEE